jgi:hypothetical protein
MGIIGVVVGLIIVILIYSEVEYTIDCPDAITSPDGNTACTKAKYDTLPVLSLIPITISFALFKIFGGSVRSGLFKKK